MCIKNQMHKFNNLIIKFGIFDDEFKQASEKVQLKFKQISQTISVLKANSEILLILLQINIQVMCSR